MTRRGERAEAPSPILSVAISGPTRLTDVQEWAAACERLGMVPDSTGIEVDGLHKRLSAYANLDDMEELS